MAKFQNKKNINLQSYGTIQYLPRDARNAKRLFGAGYGAALNPP